MSKKLTHKTTLYLPCGPAFNRGVSDAVKEATRVAGGATTCAAAGSWYNEKGILVHEQVNLVTFWYTADKESDMLEAIGEIIAQLLVTGESEVMIEKYTPSLGLRAHLFYP